MSGLFADLPEQLAPVAPVDALQIRCCVCGSDEWFSCAPGTASNASRFNGVMEFAKTDEVPPQAWCLSHWPHRKEAAA